MARPDSYMSNAYIKTLYLSLIIAGIGLTLSSLSVALVQGVTGSTVEGQQVSISTSSTMGSSQQQFSVVKPGNQYNWTVQIKNNGVATWDSGYLELRLGKPDASTHILEERESLRVNKVNVLKCGDVQNLIECREPFVQEWNLEYKVAGTENGWRSPSELNRIAKVRFNQVQPDESVTYRFRFDTPEDFDQKRVIAGNTVVEIGPELVVDTWSEEVTPNIQGSNDFKKFALGFFFLLAGVGGFSDRIRKTTNRFIKQKL